MNASQAVGLSRPLRMHAYGCARVLLRIHGTLRPAGGEGWTFPKAPPFSFALLRRDGVELMFQKGIRPERTSLALDSGWAVYIRLQGGDLLGLAAHVKEKTTLLREPTRMPYREVEFMVQDPDRHIVLGEQHRTIATSRQQSSERSFQWASEPRRRLERGPGTWNQLSGEPIRVVGEQRVNVQVEQVVPHLIGHRTEASSAGCRAGRERVRRHREARRVR